MIYLALLDLFLIVLLAIGLIVAKDNLDVRITAHRMRFHKDEDKISDLEDKVEELEEKMQKD